MVDIGISGGECPRSSFDAPNQFGIAIWWGVEKNPMQEDKGQVVILSVCPVKNSETEEAHESA